MEKKTLEVSADLYDAIQKLKEVFKEMTGQEVTEDQDVIAILVGGFIDSLSQSAQETQANGEAGAEEIAE